MLPSPQDLRFAVATVKAMIDSRAILQHHIAELKTMCIVRTKSARQLELRLINDTSIQLSIHPAYPQVRIHTICLLATRFSSGIIISCEICAINECRHVSHSLMQIVVEMTLLTISNNGANDIRRFLKVSASRRLSGLMAALHRCYRECRLLRTPNASGRLSTYSNLSMGQNCLGDNLSTLITLNSPE